jgi:hypothetical protein
MGGEIINKINESKVVGQISCLLATVYGVRPGIARQIGNAAALRA